MEGRYTKEESKKKERPCLMVGYYRKLDVEYYPMINIVHGKTI